MDKVHGSVILTILLIFWSNSTINMNNTKNKSKNTNLASEGTFAYISYLHTSTPDTENEAVL
jgi:hypothetical protein